MVDPEAGEATPHLSLEYDGRTLARLIRSVDVEDVEVDRCYREECDETERLWLVAIPDLQTRIRCMRHAWEFIEEAAPVGTPTASEVHSAAWGLLTEGLESTPIPLGKYALRSTGTLAGRFAVYERGGGALIAARLSDFPHSGELAAWIARLIRMEPPWITYPDVPVDEPLPDADGEGADTSEWGFA